MKCYVSFGAPVLVSLNLQASSQNPLDAQVQQDANSASRHDHPRWQVVPPTLLRMHHIFPAIPSAQGAL